MGGRRRRLHVERQQRNENSETKANTTTSQGKQESGWHKGKCDTMAGQQGRGTGKAAAAVARGGGVMGQDFEEK